MPLDLSNLLSTAMVAAQLGVSRMTVQRMVLRGTLTPTYRTVLGPLFDQSNVDAVRLASA